MLAGNAEEGSRGERCLGEEEVIGVGEFLEGDQESRLVFGEG